jgi:hypothetical protein
MISLEEIAKFPEYEALAKQHNSKDWIFDYLKETAQTGTEGKGFVDPLMSAHPERRKAAYDTLRQYSLKEIWGGGTGSDFYSYVVPTKVYQVLIDAFREADILNDIAGLVVNGYQGGNINVNWALMNKIKPSWGHGPGGAPMRNETIGQETVTPNAFYMDMPISQDEIEDSQVDLIEHHVRAAGAEMASFAVARALEAMYDGRDITNNVAGGTNLVTVANFVSARGMITGQSGKPDTAVITTEQVNDLLGDTTTFNFSNIFKDSAVKGELLPKFLGLNWYTRCLDAESSATVRGESGLYDTANEDYYALVFEKRRALIAAWKAPISIQNYTSPREGLVGAFCRGRIGFGVVSDGNFISAVLEGD